MICRVWSGCDCWSEYVFTTGTLIRVLLCRLVLSGLFVHALLESSLSSLARHEMPSAQSQSELALGPLCSSTGHNLLSSTQSSTSCHQKRLCSHHVRHFTSMYPWYCYHALLCTHHTRRSLELQSAGSPIVTEDPHIENLVMRKLGAHEAFMRRILSLNHLLLFGMFLVTFDEARDVTNSIAERPGTRADSHGNCFAFTNSS